MSQDRASIESQLSAFAEAWKENDGPGLAGFFVEDGSLVNPFGQRADGRAAVAAMYGDYFDGMLKGTKVATTVDHVRNVDAEHALIDAEQVIQGPGGDVVLVVHLTALLRRSGPGGWKFVDSRPFPYAAAP